MPSDVDVSSLSYEQALADLEGLITRLERGDVDLDEAVAFYQRGSALAERCAALLDRTEATVMQLVVGSGGVDEERPLATLPATEERPAPAGRAPEQAAGTDAARPAAPPPPGSPARARSVNAPSTARTAPRPVPPRPAPPTPARPAPPPPAAPQLFPGLDPAPGAPATGRSGPEGDFDLDDIPF